MDLGEAICRGKYLSQVLAKSIYIFSRLGSKNHMEFPADWISDSV